MKEPDSSQPSSKSEEFKAFEGLAKVLISVPKSEVDKKAKEYERQKQRKKRKKAAK